ncbi:glutamate racemase [Tamilnaduibacter salinus]|uniref:Glutamate racemase n=1 Tax=Tamilnaduibacter salinus TaxID=1484056 RepID=A0A2U1D0T8_9GAMM|nr:glutamate racemase [Tamilnaduibacter salinus]PVY79002.1 glutamate racemase [Tamilnaduibacter salinus]
MSARVLVFDSGLGGLTVAGCIQREMPGVVLSYLADTAGFPYGDRSAGDVMTRCIGRISEGVKETGADLVVIACNTASTLVLPRLRERLTVPVVGVVPAIKPAAAVSENRRIGILATPATVRRPYTDRLIDNFAPDCHVVRLGLSDMVRWAEDSVPGAAPDRSTLRRALAPLIEAEVDTVVLGCTHYPLLAGSLSEALPEVRHWVDSGDAIARRVRFLLDGEGLLGEALVSGPPAPLGLCFTGPVPEGLPCLLERVGLAAGSLLSDEPGCG